MNDAHSDAFRRIAPLALALIAMPGARAQKPAEFEFASIRQNISGQESFRVNTSEGGRFEVRNISVERLIQLAFDLRASQVIGSPGWTGSERYDIVARAGTRERPTLEDMKTWCQALLASRFALRFHWETRS
jgi:uncharacterized protein (TIGR03435 family)